MLTTLPQPRSYIPGRTARASRNGASTIRASMAANRSGGNSSTGATCWKPALLTSTSAASWRPSRPAGSVRSAATGVPPSSPATRSAPPPSRSTTVTLAPAAASRRAQASPIPLAAPVTRAVLPSSSTSIGDLRPVPSGSTRLPSFPAGDQYVQRKPRRLRDDVERPDIRAELDPAGRGGQLHRHHHRVVRLLPLRHGRRAGVQQAVLP